MKIDAYAHILPRAYFDRLVEIAPDKGAIRRWLTLPVLHDLGARLAVMDEFGPGYRQILSLSLPALEGLAGPDGTPVLARLANDCLAELVDRRPDRFPGFVATLGMNNVPAAVAELRRAVEELGAVGIQLLTHVGGRPLDDPEFWPVFEAIAHHDLPVWLHPARGAVGGDYAGESASRYEIWWALGWPHETSVAMARMVFSEFFVRLPRLKVICHHMGGMIPFCAGRIGHGWDQLGARTVGHDFAPLRAALGRPLEHFHRFIGDTAVSGAPAAIACGLDFFGPGRVVFGTDFPFDPEGGPVFIRETIAAIDGLPIQEAERRGIYADTIRGLVCGRLRDPPAPPGMDKPSAAERG